MSWHGYGMPGSAMLPPPQPGSVPMAPMDIPRNVMRTGEQGLWSTFKYADNLALLARSDLVFAVAMGGQGQGYATSLSIAETNMKENSRIAGAQAYDVYAIALQPYYVGDAGSYAIDGADLRNIDNNLVLFWRFLQTFIEIAPASLIGAGGGIFGSTADTGAAEGGAGGSRIALNHGAGQLWVYRQHPVLLPSNTTFNLLYAWGDYASAVDGGNAAQALGLRTVLLGRFQSAVPIA